MRRLRSIARLARDLGVIGCLGTFALICFALADLGVLLARARRRLRGWWALEVLQIYSRETNR